MTPNHTRASPATTVPVTLAGAEIPLMSSNRPTATMIVSADDDALRLGVAGEQRVEAVHQPGDRERDDEADEHRQAAERRDRLGVDRAVVRARRASPATGPARRRAG